MSVTAGLIRYPAEIFETTKAKGTFYPPNGPGIQRCFLERSWDELHPAFRSFGPPLSLALSGDYGYEGGLQHFGWDESSESDHYIGFVSPSLVAAIAKQLNGLTFGQVMASVNLPSRGPDYLAPRFRELVEFYTAAAADGNCVFIHIA